MEHVALVHQIKLHPRVSLLRGEFFERKKAGGTFSALIPHYATNGIPAVQFDKNTGEPINIQDHGAEIEINFRECDPKIQTLNARHFSNHILVQLMYGKRGESATKSACRILREASTCFANLINTKKVLYLAGLFVLKVSGGSSDGLLIPIGVFNLDGTTIWVNPEGIELDLLTVQFPNMQVEQNSKDETNWYDRIHNNLKHIFCGKELHGRILESRANTLLEVGKVKTRKAGLVMASKDAKSLITTRKKLEKELDNQQNVKSLIKTNSTSKVTREVEVLLQKRTFSIKNHKQIK